MNFLDKFTNQEKSLFKKLNTPAKIQDFLNSLPFNFEKNKETLKSPLRTLRKKKAHCFEGALLGAFVLSLHNFSPMILHLKTNGKDYDHVVALFKINKFWGALSKTNHSVLRYREPIYRNIRELVISYFHEYFTNDGKKTLREYSQPLFLKNIKRDWITSENDLWFLDKKLDKLKHYQIIPKNKKLKLRLADKIEIKTGRS